MDADITLFRDEYAIQGLSSQVIGHFRRIMCHHYQQWGRVLPWRQTTDPYRILVSEFMLQQTRVERVQEYYPHFVERFPDFSALACATIPELLREWKGLGYNRRALALRETARKVQSDHQGVLPFDETILRSLPGIGNATAAAIVAFAGNRRVLLLETNIRTVYLYFFFPGREGVRDRDILPILEATTPTRRIREYYYALMDFGVMIKKQVGNPNRTMHTYRPQPRFEGSDRQMRGRIITLLMNNQGSKEREMQDLLSLPRDRLRALLTSLEREGFLTHEGDLWSLTI